MGLPDSITYPKPPGQERPYPKPTKAGKVPFKVPNQDLHGLTAYEIYGDLESGKRPLIALHGGPGIPHSCLLPLSLLLTDYGTPVIMYDQIGCGESTHFPERAGDAALWNPGLFVAELNNLIQALGVEKFDLLGHSWGGLLAALYAATVRPAGLHKLVICDVCASLPAWSAAANELRAALPDDVKETLTRLEREGRLDSAEYEAATNEFNRRHLCRLEPLPRELTESFAAMMEDPTVTMTMFGPSDFDIAGSLRDFSVEGHLTKLTPEVVPGGMLLMNGQFEVAHDMSPYFRVPSANVRWVTFALSSHCPHLEETERFIASLGSFLSD